MIKGNGTYKLDIFDEATKKKAVEVDLEIWRILG